MDLAASLFRLAILMSERDQKVSFGLRVHRQARGETSNQVLLAGTLQPSSGLGYRASKSWNCGRGAVSITHQTMPEQHSRLCSSLSINGHTSMLESPAHICRDFKILEDEPTPDGLPEHPAPTPDALSVCPNQAQVMNTQQLGMAPFMCRLPVQPLDLSEREGRTILGDLWQERQRDPVVSQTYLNIPLYSLVP